MVSPCWTSRYAPTTIDHGSIDNDCAVIWTSPKLGKFKVGRNRLANERSARGEMWHLHTPGLIPTWGNGSADNLPAAPGGLAQSL
jgi:hypothetical protein